MLNEKLDLTGTIVKVMPYMDLLAVGYLVTGSYYEEHHEELRAKGRGIPLTITVGDDIYTKYRIIQMYGYDSDHNKTGIPYMLVAYSRKSSRNLDYDLRVLCRMVTGADIVQGLNL